MEQVFTSGFVSIVGNPNVGKSTFLNRVLETKISITSTKPQTTRDRILGIFTTETTQILFLDTPGIHFSNKALNRYMLEKTLATLGDSDLVLVMTDPFETREDLLTVAECVAQAGKEAFLVVNKIDLVKGRPLDEVLSRLGSTYSYTHLCGVSSLGGEGIGDLVERIRTALPEGPKYFPEDMITDLPVRFLCREIIREKVFDLTRKEIPYAVAVEIEEFREQDNVYIRAVIHVERSSQKGIIIGAGGKKLKEIGTSARIDIELLLGQKVFLDLFVRVTPDWSKHTRKIKSLGYA
ncbi:MAG TPA: GTPase Era [Deltaproteobacteria bacterium]|nr:GTPase Era [Deltaproteobacteria bacterium]